MKSLLALCTLLLGMALGSVLTWIRELGVRRRFKREVEDAIAQAMCGTPSLNSRSHDVSDEEPYDQDVA